MSRLRWACVLMTVCCAGALASSCAAPPPGPKVVPIAEQPIPDVMRRVADYQLQANASKKHDPGWVRANLYPGILATYAVTKDERYLTATTRWASEEGHWTIPGGAATRPARQRRHADNQAIGWTYATLAELTNDRSRMADVSRMVDEIEAGHAAGRVEWWWCDAINMAPPTLARAYAVSGDPKYLVCLDRLLPDAIDFLYDRDEHLFFRDAKQFARRHDGKKIFWSRGNGWVVAGLARVLHDLPKDHPTRARYEAVFRELCTRVAGLQGKDGLWRSNLLVPGQFPNPETSGTALFTFGMAQGINDGSLDRATFEPVVRRGWSGLLSCLTEEGKLGFVQQVGDVPRGATADMTQEYAVGAFLMAAEQVMRLDQPTAPSAPAASRPARAHAMFVPQRLDDFAWENDKVAFRAYGPALEKQDGPQSGIDIWVKRVPDLVQAKWYAHGDYHHDNGEGLDGYKVGTTRGVGGTAVIKDGKAYPSGNFTAYRILENGPDRVVFELDYGPWDAGGTKVKETKRITLEAGSYFNKIESTFTFEGPPIDVGVGLKSDAPADGPATMPARGTGATLTSWEPLDGPASNGSLGAAVVSGAGTSRTLSIGSDRFLVTRVVSGERLRYLAGGGWSHAGFATQDDWRAIVRTVAARPGPEVREEILLPGAED